MKTYIITNALSSLGRSLSVELAKQNHSLILSGDNYSELEKLLEEINEMSSVHHEVFLLEQSKEIDWLNMVEKIDSTFDGLDGIVFIHSIHTENNSIYDVSYDEFNRLMHEHAWGAYLGIRTLRNLLRDGERAEIINVVEPTTDDVFEHNLYYTITGAIKGLTKSMTEELSKEDIDVYTLSYRPKNSEDTFETNDVSATRIILEILEGNSSYQPGKSITIH